MQKLCYTLVVEGFLAVVVKSDFRGSLFPFL